MARQKICILFSGGTIGMIEDPQTKVLRPMSDVSDFLRKVPELQRRMHIDFKPIINIDSSNVQPYHWTELAKAVKKHYSEYDGFVVAHGTDTMAYSASALSFALQNLSKPIVFTGSLIPMSDMVADAVNNLTYACLIASMDIAEVCIMFGHRIIRGNRAKKHHESFVNVFHSPNYPELGEIGRPITLNEWRKKRRKRILKYQPEFEAKIALLKLFPGFDPVIIDRAIERGIKGMIIEGFGPGNVPFVENSIVSRIEKATKKGIPVIVGNQMEHGVTNLQAYEAGYLAAEAGAISSGDMTTEATLAKLMWALKKEKTLKKVQSLVLENLVGELS